MDNAIALEVLGFRDQDWGSNYSGTYQELKDGWRGDRECPSQADLEAAHDEYLAGTDKRGAKEELTKSDAGMARVLDDVIALLALDGVLDITKLPQEAQDKLKDRKELRSK